jgi:hypothetical protein
MSEHLGDLVDRAAAPEGVGADRVPEVVKADVGGKLQRFVTSNSCRLFRREYRWLDHRLHELTEEEALLGVFEALS